MTIRIAALVTLAVLFALAPAHADEPTWGGEPLSHWIEQLEKGPTGLGKAPEALIAIGEPALPSLRRSLMAISQSSRANAADVLGQMQAVAEPLLPDIAELLADDVPTVRRAAALSLGRIGRALSDGEVALETLERLTEAAARLRERLSDSDKEVRTAVLQGMALLGGFSQDDIRRRLQNHNKRAVFYAAIGELKTEATGIAVSLLKHPSWHVRQWTVRYMARAELDKRSWYPALADLTHDESEAVAHEALGVLASRTAKDKSAAELALRAFTSPHPKVRVWAPSSIMRAETNGPAATRHLLTAVGSDEVMARRGAAWGLGQSTAQRKDVIAALAKLLSDKDEITRWSAARSLATLGETPDAAIAPLAEAMQRCHLRAPYKLEYQSDDVMAGSKRHMGYWGMAAPEEAWPLLLKFGERGAAHVAGLEVKDEEHGKWLTLHALAEFKEAGVPHIRKRLESRDAETRIRAALTLLHLQQSTPDCVTEFLGALERRSESDDDEIITEEPEIGAVDWHETALTALRKLGKDAVPTVLEQLAASRRADQRRMETGLKTWLVEIGEPALPHLEGLRANFELGQWINAVISAIEAKLEKAKEKPDKPKDG